MRIRSLGYLGGLSLVPVVWLAQGRQGRYPIAADLAMSAPLLIDAAGNSLGIYDDARDRRPVHFLNATVLASLFGAVISPRDVSRAAASAATLRVRAHRRAGLRRHGVRGRAHRVRGTRAVCRGHDRRHRCGVARLAGGGGRDLGAMAAVAGGAARGRAPLSPLHEAVRDEPRSTRAKRGPASFAAARTSSWVSGSPVMPAPGLVTSDTPQISMPAHRAAIASSTVDMPTASAPSVRSIRTSAGVS